MNTSWKGAQGSRSDPEVVGRTLTATLLKARASLPKAQNGEHVLLSDPYAAKVAKEMSQERSQEFKRIYAVCQCMLIDGVSLPLVTAAMRQLLTMLEVESSARTAEKRHAVPTVLPMLLRAETRAQGRLDIAQLRVLETPECPNALTDVLHEADRYTAALDPFVKVCTVQLHRTKSLRQSVGGMQVMRGGAR